MSAVKPYKRIPSKRQKAQRTSLYVLSVRRLTLFIIGMSFCVFTLWSYFHASTLMLHVRQSAEKYTADAGFRLEDVIVEGRIRTDKSQILNILKLEHGKPLLSINLSEAKAKLEAVSWVKAVRIERRFPNTLFIWILEKEPVALWQAHDKIYLVDGDGELMEIHEVHQYKDLLPITGDQAPHHVGSLVALLDKFPEIKKRVTSATHLRSRRWDIRLDGKIDIKLPEKEVERALAYLLKLENQHSLSEQKITTIDMRLPDQLILRLTPDAVQGKKGTGKDA